MDEVRLGTIGSGVIVRGFLDNVRRVDDMSLAAVYSRSSDTGRALAERYGGDAPVYTDLDAFFSDRRVNTVYIASPNLLHFEQMKKALLAGKHVICEKPFCLHSSKARELVRLAEERGLMLVEAVPTPFLPNYTLLRSAVGEVGRIRLIQANYSQYSSRYDLLLAEELPNIFNPAFGGGCLMDINFYNIYLTVALFGKPKSAAYYPNIYPGAADTSGVAIMRYDGFVGACTGAKDAWGQNAFQVEGERGYVCVPGGSNGLKEIHVVTPNGRKTLNDQRDPDRLFYEVKALARILKEEDHDTLQRRMGVTLNTVEVLESMRREAAIQFPGD